MCKIMREITLGKQTGQAGEDSLNSLATLLCCMSQKASVDSG